MSIQNRRAKFDYDIKEVYIAGIVLESKMKHPKCRWIGVPVVMATNVLPKVMHEPTKYDKEEDYEFQYRKNDHLAMISRCKLVKMEHSHTL